MGTFHLSAFWLQGEAIQALLSVLAEEGEGRIVGGAVRNALLSLPPGDIDIATDLPPDRVEALAAANGYTVHPTGIAHGTVTVVVDGYPFEVTTLREDVSTDGRRATVRFSTDWRVDAGRRDFTMNALYLTANGDGFDYFGGFSDCLAGKVRFIGDATQRIEEDHLRILRFFRFHAAYGRGQLDPEGLNAVRSQKESIATLPAERILHELSRLLGAPGAADVVETMVTSGVFAPIFPEPLSAQCFATLSSAERRAGRAMNEALAFLALAGFDSRRFEALGQRLKFSRRTQARGLAALKAAAAMPPRSVPQTRSLLYDFGAEAFVDGVLVSTATGGILDMNPFLAEARRWSRPRFPVSGHDLLAQGGAAGPELGQRLQTLEGLWRDSEFRLGREALLALDRDRLDRAR